VNVAVLSGTVGVELQFVPVVHSAPGPIQVPSTARAGVTLTPIATNTANAPARLMVAPPLSTHPSGIGYSRRSFRLRSTPLDTVLKTNSICEISATVADPVN
jgi:hypothetical protein